MDVKRYAGWCGPKAIASVYNTPRLEAAELLDGLGGNVGDGGTTIEALTDALGTRVRMLQPWFPDRNTFRRNRWGGIRRMPSIRYPTTTQFLKEHPRGEYVLLSRNHVIHVKDGEVVEDNGNGGSRMRIRGAWPIGAESLDLLKIRGPR